MKRRLLGLPRLTDPIPADVYLEAADIYRLAKRKGFTIRSSVDCVIAAIAIRHDMPLLQADRDFDVIARFSALRTIEL